jgi:hypothetical protein
VPFLVEDPHAEIFGGDDFVWPMRFAEAGAILESQTSRQLQFAAALEDLEARFVVMGCIPLTIATLTTTDAALHVVAAERAGISFSALPEIARFLAGDIGIDELGAPFSANGLIPGQPPLFAWLRQVRISSQWNGARSFAGLLRPEATVVSVNGLIKDHLLRADVPVRFRHQWSVFNASRRNGSAYRVDLDALASQFAEAMSDIAELPDAIRARLQVLLQREARYALGVTAGHLNKMSALRRFPRQLWSGSGGHYGTRLIGLEVMRRGGWTRRFAHGLNSSFMFRNKDPIRTTEFLVSNEFTLPTSKFLEHLDEIDVIEETPEVFRVMLSSGSGDPHLFERQPSGAARQRSRLPRVLYAPTPARGFRQYLSPQLPDVPYFDWRARLFRHIEMLPIEMIYTLHPRERRIGNGTEPSNGTLITDRNFEDLIPEVDIILLDYLKSTTAASAICSNKPVIYIDLEGLEFEARSLEHLQDRCTVLHASHDDHGRPDIDWEELAAALVKTRHDVDVSFFRELYTGET